VSQTWLACRISSILRADVAGYEVAVEASPMLCGRGMEVEVVVEMEKGVRKR
jgi:hypothetical protein